MVGISATESIVEYIALRKRYFQERRKTANRVEKTYIEACLRELDTVEKFVAAIARDDTQEQNRMTASLRATLNVDQRRMPL